MNSENPLMKEVDKLLKSFATTLSKPQFVHFEQIVKGILFTELKSINSYSKSSLKSQSSMSRFMNSKAVNQKKIKDFLHDLIKSKLDFSQDIDYIIDDTIKHHKHAKHIYGLGNHHDHLNGGYSNGHNLVVGGIRQSTDFQPTDFELYIRQVDVCETSTFKTKIDMAQAMLDKWLDIIDNVLIDSWYATQDILSKISKKNKFFFTMLKSDRNFKIGRKRVRQVQEWNKYIDPREYEIIELNGQYHAVYEVIGTLPKVGKVKILFSKFYNPITKVSKKVHYLCTNNIELSAYDILLKYRDRWPIETFFRDIKQNLGFEKCIIRHKSGINMHCIMQFIAHNILVFSKRNPISCGETQRDLKYSYIETVLQNYGLKNQNLEECKKELAILC
jgi:hypothetical protein